MGDPSEYSIPFPSWFRCPPLVRIPWGVTDLPKLMKGAETAEGELREKIKRSYQVRYCILTDCSKSALALYLEATGARGRWIMPSFGYLPTAALLVSKGVELAFSNIDESFCPRPADLEEAYEAGTKVVFLTHMFGRVAPLDRIHEWAVERGIRILSNMVHLPGGVTIREKPLSHYFDVGFLSFWADKPLQGIYGGALLTNDADLASRCEAIARPVPTGFQVSALMLRALLLYRYRPGLAPLVACVKRIQNKQVAHNEVKESFLGFDWSEYDRYVSRAIHPWQAACANQLIDSLPERVRKRQSLARMSIGMLSDLEQLVLPRETEYSHTYQSFPVILKPGISRYEVGAKLARQGIETKWRYYPLHLLPRFAKGPQSRLVKTVEIWKRYLLLPVLSGDEQNARVVANSVHDLLG